MQALQRPTHATTYGGGGVVKVGEIEAVAPHLGEEPVGPARELALEGLQGRAEDDLGVVVEWRGVEGADTVSVCARTHVAGSAIEIRIRFSRVWAGAAYRRASRMVRSGTSVARLSFSL